MARGKLEGVLFDERILSCRNAGVFPDMAIRVNRDKSIFTGGELIELNDSDSYMVSSFNSDDSIKKQIDCKDNHR